MLFFLFCCTIQVHSFERSDGHLLGRRKKSYCQCLFWTISCTPFKWLHLSTNSVVFFNKQNSFDFACSRKIWKMYAIDQLNESTSSTATNKMCSNEAKFDFDLSLVQLALYTLGTKFKHKMRRCKQYLFVAAIWSIYREIYLLDNLSFLVYNAKFMECMSYLSMFLFQFLCSVCMCFFCVCW